MTADRSHVRILQQRVADSVRIKELLLADEALLAEAAQVAGAVVASLRRGGKVLFFGNGGSSTDAGHLAAELLGRFYLDRSPLPAVALADCTAAMTAIGNDFGYDDTFVRQLRGLGRAGDVAIGLSTSGNSANVVRALEAARDAGMTAVAFTGARGGRAAEVAEYALRVPTDDTPRVQECHMLLGHTICEIVEGAMAGHRAEAPAVVVLP